MPTRFGQLVVGAPGAGKTTYCEGMRQYLSALGRDPAIINLDPATTSEATFDIDITELVSIEGVMDEMKLGPNGAMIYCLEYLNENVDWLLKKLDELSPNKYVVFDFPGQLELFTHCSSVLDIMKQLTKLDYRLTVVNLIDAHHCSDPSKFIAASLLSLTMMVRLEMPHINVLSKIDLMNQFGMLPMNLEFFTDLQDMPRLLMYLDEAPAALNGDEVDDDDEEEVGGGGGGGGGGGSIDKNNEKVRNVNQVNNKSSASNAELDLPYEEVEEVYGEQSTPSSLQVDVKDKHMNKQGLEEVDKSELREQQQQHQSFLERRRRLHAAMCELIEDFSLVSFETLDIQSAESVGRVLSRCDKANGYIFNTNEEAVQQTASAKYASSLFSAISTDTEMFAERTFLVQEKYGRKKTDEFGGAGDS